MEYIENSFIHTTSLHVSHHSSMSFSILLSGWHFFILLNPDDLNSVNVFIGAQFLDELSFYSMIHLTCNITNLYCSAHRHDRELCNSLFERVFICIYAIPHLDTYLWCQFHHFHIQNEVSHATNLPRKFSFQKVRGDLDCKEEHSQVAKLDPIGFC